VGFAPRYPLSLECIRPACNTELVAPENPNPNRNPLNSATRYMLVDFLADFPDDEACLVYLWDQRYNLGDDRAHCERCGEIRQFRRYTAKQQRQDWTCTACGLHVHPTAGTIFHKSSTGLHLWFYAMYLMTSTRSGISAKQLERELGVTYKTAWRIFHLIRNELMAPDGDVTLSGTGGSGEIATGGRPRASEQWQWGPAGSRERRSGVFGVVERARRVAAVVMSQEPDTIIGRNPH
jgi:transposase